MSKKILSDNSKKLISYLMSDETICKKVKSAGEQGEDYAIYSIKDSGIVVLGKTQYPFWNRLIKCQFPLTFQAFAAAVWDALVDLAKDGNREALNMGLSREIMEKAQREKEYNWVVERLVDCYRHVCNNKEVAGVDTAGSRRIGSNVGSSKVVVTKGDNPVNVNVNIEGRRRTLHFPDATGKAFLDVELGVTGIGVSRGSKDCDTIVIES
jgi:hypothetical protein